MPFKLNAITGKLDLVNGYVAPPTNFDITSFSNNVGAVEKGLTVDDATFDWIFNKTETDQTISPPLEHPAVGVRQKIYSSLGLTSDATWTLWGTDGSTTDTSYSTIYFRSKRYWEANALASVNNSDILAMTQELATGYASTKVFNCTGGKYIWYCFPASWGTATFWVGGLQVIFNLTVQSVTNASGFTCDYNLYRSTYLQNGNPISVVIQ